MTGPTIPPEDEVQLALPDNSYQLDVEIPGPALVVTGIDLPQGPEGPPGPPGPGLTWRGTWASTTDYLVNDVVGHVGSNGIVSSYICIQQNTNVAPVEGANSAYWNLVAQEGGTGLAVTDTASIDLTNTAGTLSASVIPGGHVHTAHSLPLHDEGDNVTNWSRVGGTGSISVAQVADSSVGGNVISVAGWVQIVRMPLVPYDPNALYRMRFRIRRTVNPGSGSNSIYAGFEGVAADGVTPVGPDGATNRSSNHNMVARGASLVVAGGWQTFVGYAKGVAATGTDAATTVSTPGQMHQNTRYIRPQIIVNSGDSAGRAEIDYISLEIMPQVAAGAAEVQLSGGGGSDAPLSAALTGNVVRDLYVSNHNLAVTGVAGSTGDAYIWSRIFLGRTDVSLGVWDSNLRFQRIVNSKQVVTTQIIVDEYTVLYWDFNVSNVNQGAFYVSLDTTTGLPSIRVADKNSVVRPVPFATSAGQAPVVIGTAASSGSVVVNLPASRFTQVPLVVASSSTNIVWLGTAANISATQFTAYVRNVDNATGTGTFNVQWIAVQMTPTSTPGGGPALREGEREPVRDEGYVYSTSICHTEGCENCDIPIEGSGPPGAAYWCGACHSPITDIVETPATKPSGGES